MAVHARRSVPRGNAAAFVPYQPKSRLAFGMGVRENLPGSDAQNFSVERSAMADSVYKVIELVGTSSESWEKAARNAVETAMKSLKDIRVAEVDKLDMQIEDGKVVAYRARVMVSFKYHTDLNDE
jgi:flavin-binding protein dodecin